MAHNITSLFLSSIFFILNIVDACGVYFQRFYLLYMFLLFMFILIGISYWLFVGTRMLRSKLLYSAGILFVAFALSTALTVIEFCPTGLR